MIRFDGVGCGLSSTKRGRRVPSVRRIPDAQADLVGTLELALSPTWLWPLFGEAPGWPVLVGGAITSAAIILHTALDLAATRHPVAQEATA